MISVGLAELDREAARMLALCERDRRRHELEVRPVALPVASVVRRSWWGRRWR